MADLYHLSDVKKRNGFLLIEAVLALGIFLLLASFSFSGEWNLERHQLDAVTREVALEIQGIRQHALANSGSKDVSWRLAVRPQGYMLVAGNIIQKRCSYGYGVHLSANDPGKDFRFNDEGKPKQDTHVLLQSRSGAYERKIVIAVQTGRIRIE